MLASSFLFSVLFSFNEKMSIISVLLTARIVFISSACAEVRISLQNGIDVNESWSVADATIIATLAPRTYKGAIERYCSCPAVSQSVTFTSWSSISNAFNVLDAPIVGRVVDSKVLLSHLFARDVFPTLEFPRRMIF
ncbi:hypothetical protein TRFO_41176 [Tritrichomonas foetus]|uniref:Uncharacterized protein n=1 Tax=Tritrichomonas foetus TaxID=1144522 RepID=A0A1J4L173_9EUKA|nr:hypothetical protein TRFO_41176 [Tritrichomonas foetus]|eukprot:OHT17265.1 hypothetical protein TRFO_41176 [Tritrichomonas foetus]